MPRVVIGIGHGGNDPGNINFGVKESVTNLALGGQVAHYVRLLGGRAKNGAGTVIECATSRCLDTPMTAKDRVDVARQFGADLLVDIHTNSMNLFSKLTNKNVHGSEVLVKAPPALYHAEMTALGIRILSYLDDVGLKARRVIDRKRLAILEGFPHSIIVEVGYASNVADARKMNDPKGRGAIAIAIARAIVEYYGIVPAMDEV